MNRRVAEINRDLEGRMAPHELADLLAKLDAQPVPYPTPAATEALIAALRPLVPPARRQRFRSQGLQAQPMVALLSQMVAQVREFPLAWWLATLAAVICGLVAAPALASANVPVSVLTPLLVIGGVMYSFRTLKGGALEIELSCPITPAQLILSRVMVMLGYYLVLGLGVAAWLGAPAGALLLNWLAALLLFTGLMLTLTLSMGTVSATVLALLFWGAQLLLREKMYSLFMEQGHPGWLQVQVSALVVGLLLSLLALRGTAFHRLIGWGER
jgi:hypothetical protein